MSDDNAPSPADLRHLRPSNGAASLHLLFGIVSIAAGVTLSWEGQPLVSYLFGQAVLAVAFIHAFILLHEAGHHTLFRQARLNDVVGHLAGFVALIPYVSWKPIHDRHHRYTGWQDLDATTATLVPRPVAGWERRVMDFAWRSWLPLFSILYRLQNYWHLSRVMRFLGPKGKPVRLGLNIAFLLAGYAVLLGGLGAVETMRLLGPGLLMALMAQDIILLSQHTHMPTHLSEGREVRPFPYVQQAPFTRSMRVPAWFSLIIMHFDSHELHHMYPAVPGYLLPRIPYTPPNEVNWLAWIRRVKRLSGTAFLFGKPEETGVPI